ncbi:tetratricopeptide repeat protein [Seleniivibrio woodruffii]|uniref:tetratricopeptide repeat protein n=1 Tax=Seleniivibrio woodruffii TaxID=1078050 RepID=UPI0024092EDE|nr:tetratricopeptide repeat protein [Seleniivibrio woodruffii]
MNLSDLIPVRREGLLDTVREALESDISETYRIFSIYGHKGTGRTVFADFLRKELSKDSYLVMYMDAEKACSCYPEQGLIELRDCVSGETADYFALYDISVLVRSEKINGKLKTESECYFRNNSPMMSEVISKSPSKYTFTRSMYDEVGKSFSEEWFNREVRPQIIRMFKEPNHMNWQICMDSFAACLAAVKNTANLEPVLIIDNAENLFDAYDHGVSWVTKLAEKAGCSTLIYISEDQISSDKYGYVSTEINIDTLSKSECTAFCRKNGLERDSMAELIFENTDGHPALTAFSLETYKLVKSNEGHEPGPEVFESNPQSIVHMSLSSLKSTESIMAKLLSCCRVFDEGLFKAVAQEFTGTKDASELFQSLVSRSFITDMGAGFFCVHPLYRMHSHSVLDSDLLENVNYAIYRYHIGSAEAACDYKELTYHIKESVHHAMHIMEIEGFVEWFSTLEKKFYTVEFFNFWLDMLDAAKSHIAGILGETHPQIASYFDKLAFMYLKSGRQVSAEKVLHERLEAEEAKSGKNSSDAVPFMNKLANFYIDTGDFSAAEAIMKKGMEIREQFHGKKSADYADSVLKLGKLYHMAGDREGAIQKISEAEEIYNKALDVKDTARLEADEVMASIYSAAGQIAKAALIYHKLTTVRNETMGPMSKEAVKSLGDYAKVVFKNGNSRKAVKLYEDLITKTKKIYGDNSRMTAAAANDLAVAYQRVQEFEKSESMHNEALNIKQNIYGTNHPSTAVSYTNFGQLKYAMGDLKNAEPYYFKALQIYETVFGDRHEKTAVGLNNMGFITSRMGQFERAQEYYEKALDIKKEIGGERSISAAAAMNNLGELLFRIGKKEEAREFLTTAHDIYKEIYGEEHEYTKLVAKNLAAVS